jgi:hypothetical protein
VNYSNKNSHNVNLIFDRLKLYHGLGSDSELAALLGINKSTLSMQRTRGSTDLQSVLHITDGIDLNWLLRTADDHDSQVGNSSLSTSEQRELYSTSEQKLIDEIIRLRKKITDLEDKLQNS